MTRCLALLLAAAALAPPVHGAPAADCAERPAVGYRVLALPDGRKAAVWYPAAGSEEAIVYLRGGPTGRAVRDAPPARCPRAPLVLFSHGLGACALQSTVLTEALARRGYVVAAPDHADAATCSIGGDALRLQNIRTQQPLYDPARWDERSELGRLHDLRATIDAVGRDPALARIADVARVGAVGHSLGGYSVLALGGAWPSWRTPAVQAVVALSPFVAPFLAHGTLPRLAVPVMYQGAQFDWGITPTLEGATGAFAASPAPKVYAKLKGGLHVEWTDLACLGLATAAACREARPNAALIERSVGGFLDRYLAGEPAAGPAADSGQFAAYRYVPE